jgi:hypothetical protein
MIQKSIYIDRSDAKEIEEEERNLFIRSILEQLGVPLDQIWPDISLTIENKIKLRQLLSKLEIEIIDTGDRGCTIYNNDTKLGEWFKPKFILREDKKARTLSKKLYYEMVIKTWSVFDQQEE